MKKILGILGVAAFAGAMFLNTNTFNDSKTALSLDSLVSLNSANAECNEWAWPMQCNAFDRCSAFGSAGGCDVR